MHTVERSPVRTMSCSSAEIELQRPTRRHSAKAPTKPPPQMPPSAVAVNGKSKESAGSNISQAADAPPAQDVRGRLRKDSYGLCQRAARRCSWRRCDAGHRSRWGRAG